ncbi:hypothetical protein ESCO_002838 [Escovopsis weberi]|uniref:SUR7 family protein pun1 n=1 Tax=Escovopsis weberi TaxID=150374 RepID=A0A0M9VSE1_ESCWE|nr:hypothetical protein ESCO_002838 [Escovopsis weberi]
MLPNLKTTPPRQFAVAIPMVLCFVTFILTMLALFAGHQKGFMEDYAIIRRQLNTSMIGRPAAQGKLGALVGSAVGSAADKMGVSDWYSIHVLDSCEGQYGAHSELVVKKCSSSSPNHRFNLTQALDHELSLGPLHINTAQLGLPPSLQPKIDAVNDVLYTLFVLLVLASTAAFLAVPAAAGPAILPAQRRTHAVLLNMALTSLAAFCAFLASTVVTAAAAIGASALNDAGAPLGVVAVQGSRLIVLAWVATGLVGLGFVYWAGELLLGYLEKRRERRRAMMEAKLPY